MLVWALAFLTIAGNAVFLILKWLPMKRGKAPKEPFIKKGNRRVLWFSMAMLYCSMALFSAFYNTDVMTKARIFAVAITLTQFLPQGMVLILAYSFLFDQNRKFMRIGQSEGENKTDE